MTELATIDIITELNQMPFSDFEKTRILKKRIMDKRKRLVS